jgi:hypothetical protein
MWINTGGVCVCCTDQNEFVFPMTLNFQNMRLSANGQDLGGEQLFKRRMGFSGTPNNNLPLELQPCAYMKGDDAKMLQFLTDPKIVEYESVPIGWDVTSLLDTIATANPPYHALIDTGALITGMSNLEVAQYLLKHGLADFDSVVFLDEDDKKQMLIRNGMRVVPMAQSTVSEENRFTFFDQIHTTGIVHKTPISMH